ncbi:abortive infection family protein [Cupriavidus necator]|uniref:abortive infection family protein n=1 Tax=Cupriavidus necator TaxID=106590 RepID=UPI00138E1173|nr:abortive infection family protein [Cupriavidus necator]QQB81561.1 abortive infection family protein [Cupriavidus necator]
MALEKLLGDDAKRNKAFATFAKVLERRFSESDWASFGHEHNIEEIYGNDHLLRSAQYGNSDYRLCILRTLEFLFDDYAKALKALLTDASLHNTLKREDPDLYAIVTDEEVPHVPAKKPRRSKLEVVRKALHDAETLLASGGPTSAVDRVHTALHGYLREVCDKAKLSYGAQPTVTELYKLIRTEHPAFDAKGTHAEAIKKVANGMASTLDGLNTLRNQASVAHPNEDLLDDVDAGLAVNAARTVFNYVAGKVGD